MAAPICQPRASMAAPAPEYATALVIYGNCPICLEDITEQHWTCFRCTCKLHSGCADRLRRRGPIRCPVCRGSYAEALVQLCEPSRQGCHGAICHICLRRILPNDFVYRCINPDSFCTASWHTACAGWVARCPACGDGRLRAFARRRDQPSEAAAS